MTPVLTIARLTLKEAARRRLLRVLTILTLICVGLTAWLVSATTGPAREFGAEPVFVEIGIALILVVCAFMFSFILAMTAGFLASPAIASDIESGIAQALLARPIRRSDYLIGRWLGLAIVIAAYAVASGLLEIAVVGMVSGYWPPEPVVAVVFLAFEAIIMLTLGLLLSTRLSAVAGGAITVVAFALPWLTGVIGGIATGLGSRGVEATVNLVSIVLPIDLVWRGVIYGLQPLSVRNFAGGQFNQALEAFPFYQPDPPSLLVIGGATAWIVVVLGLAIRTLDRREV
jgi:ABC-type transport system involved in multi-copper enzyme maturation permease subunit